MTSASAKASAVDSVEAESDELVNINTGFGAVNPNAPITWRATTEAPLSNVEGITSAVFSSILPKVEPD